MPKKRQQQDEQFQVEVVTAARVHREGFSWEYHVKWAGWESESDSWEPEDNLSTCDELLKRFWEHVGILDDDNADYPPGHEARAKSEWIEHERAQFRETYPEELELAIRQRQRIKRKEKQQEERAEQKKLQKMERERLKRLKLVEQQPADSRPPKGKRKVQTVIVTDSGSGNSDEGTTSAVRVPTKRKAPQLTPITIPPLKQLSAQDVLPPLRKVSEVDKKGSPVQTAYPNIVVKDKGKQKESKSLVEQRTRESSVESTDSLFSAQSFLETSSRAATAVSQVPKSGSASKTIGHAKKKKEPRIKIFEPENLKGGSFLATKRKLAQKDLILSDAPPSKQQISNLHFKRNVPSPNSPNESQAALPPPPEPVLVPDDLYREIRISPFTTNAVDAAALVHASEEYVPLADYDLDPFESFVPPDEPDVTPVLRTPALPPVSVQDAFAEADAFLNEMMTVDSAAPAVPADGPATELAAPPKITNTWKWTGELLIEHEANKAERLCEIVLTDATDYLTEGLRLNILLSETKMLRFLKLCRVSDLDLILKACKPSEQVARLEPHTEEDGVVLKALADTMILSKQVTFTRLFQHGYEVARLLTFPSSMNQLCDRFKVPDSLRSSILVSAVVPLSIKPGQRELEWRCYNDDNTKATHRFSKVMTAERIKHVKFDPRYSRGIRSLELPDSLQNFLSQSPRVYSVWDGPTTMTRTESEWLISILNRSGAKKAVSNTEGRLVFVHVGAIRTLPKFAHLAEKRSKNSHIQFYTYGTHETVPLKRWNIHEIFPLGGVVTFTPQAMVDNPVGVYELIKQIAMHKCWTAFLLPEVVGMASNLIHGSEDPLAAFDRGEFIFEMLLKQIEDGMISLTSSPSVTHSQSSDSDPVFDWIETQLKVASMQARGYLEECIQSWRVSYSKVPEREWSTVMEAQIMNQMNQMQMQPEIMDNYRRFVVIEAASEVRMSEYRGGLEYLTLSTFDFNDQYFTPEERDRAR